ncbi:MAG TPA: ABC transporter ATP-binding protein [Rhodothermales bacterium]|nr:ABC transporter ATP-binding protein [Rhodothermales bacterium]
MSAVEAHNLVKRFGETTAVDGVSFAVEQGEVFGIIGPDGAGKTTLFRMLISLLVPDGGEARVLGFDVVKDYREIRRRVGYMPGRFSLYPDLSVEENLNFFASIFGTTVEANYHLIEEIYSQIEPFKDRRAGALSGGMKQKLALCCALIHQPEVLFLDEPTTGVDAVSRREFWEMLARLKSRGVTIVVSTPYMDEAGRCDRVALMQGGRILRVDTPAAVSRSFDHPLLGVKAADRHRLMRVLQAAPFAHSVYPFGEWFHYADSRSEADPEGLLRYLESEGLHGAQVTTLEPGIEDAFMELMGEPAIAAP